MFKIQPYLISFLLAFSISLSSKEEDQAINLIYQKIVALEQEIASLRSLVEENAYLIEKSQELQKQRYMDLDQRLHELKIQSNSEEKKLLSYEQEALIGPGPEILLYKEALEIIKIACKNSKIVGADVNELAPIKGFNSYNFLVAKLVYKILSYKFLYR